MLFLGFLVFRFKESLFRSVEIMDLCGIFFLFIMFFVFEFCVFQQKIVGAGVVGLSLNSVQIFLSVLLHLIFVLIPFSNIPLLFRIQYKLFCGYPLRIPSRFSCFSVRFRFFVRMDRTTCRSYSKEGYPIHRLCRSGISYSTDVRFEDISYQGYPGVGLGFFFLKEK
ncbi:hypothetical protein ES332_D06G000500v1 [Gossypium tomentosum]|uniref:Uncharacterized protein n=1 Tax=Gossypium tomentosum TaxID=34277 RepID=A0A5D2KBW2_GOSTO|nr:hypothetical protein ES332_D06G000500v1 [Gossypium tomentosum]